jgi:hypothetical protein
LRSIDDIIDDWKTEFGTMAYGKHGAFYRYIDWKIEKNLLLNLAQTLIDEGHKESLVDEDNRPNASTQLKVVNACAAPDGASSRKKSDILKSKRITALNWKEVLKEFFRGTVSIHVPENRVSGVEIPEIETKPSKSIEVDPSDRIKMDTSDIVEADLDLDFLKELDIELASVTGKDDE